jgi:hypothetical protein
MNRNALPASNRAVAESRALTTGTLRRLVCALALLPVVPAGAFIAATCCDEWFYSSTFDTARWFNLFIAALAVALSVLIWRTVILWTLGRTALTALVSMIPFVQVIWACGTQAACRATSCGPHRSRSAWASGCG